MILAKCNGHNGVFDVRKGHETVLCMLTWTQTTEKLAMQLTIEICLRLPSSAAKATHTDVIPGLGGEYNYRMVSSAHI